MKPDVASVAPGWSRRSPAAGTWARAAAWVTLSYAFLFLVLGGAAAADLLLGERQEPVGWADVRDAGEVLGAVAVGWVLFYAPWLLLWHRATRRRSAVESRRVDVVGGSTVTAALGATGVQLVAPDLFHTVRWLEVVLNAGVFFAFPWVALFVARLLMSRRPTEARSEGSG